MTHPRPQANTLKQHLRREALARRGTLDPALRHQASADITRRILALPEIQHARTIGLYVSFRDEVETHGLIERLLARGTRVALPRILPERRALEMHAVERFPDGLVPGVFGISEPDPQRHPEVLSPRQIDVFLVPGVVFDRDGYRIGYGGGYYDRLLAEPHTALAIGLCFHCQLVDTFARDPWDKPVDEVVSEQGVTLREIEQAP